MIEKPVNVPTIDSLMADPAKGDSFLLNWSHQGGWPPKNEPPCSTWRGSHGIFQFFGALKFGRLLP
jgi:hypothetical protein